MKKVLVLFLFIAGAMMVNAQKTITLPTSKIEMTGKLSTTDLTISIDKIDDVFNPAYTTVSPRYDVHYTVTNIGTEDISGLLIGLQANFYKSDGTQILGNTNFGLAGPIAEQNEVRVIKPGAKVQRIVSVYPQQPLYFNASYKLVIVADNQNKIAESNESNNTAERVIVPHSDYPETDYFLTKVTLTIQTGNDNKEAKNSDVNFYFRTGDGIKNYWHVNYNNEIKINSTTTISINNEGTSSEGITNYTANNTLQYYKQHGFITDIIYDNLIKTDAWKINSVSVTLQFKTKNGVSSPTYGTKTVNFSNANGLLGFRVGDSPFSNQYQKRALRLYSCYNCISSHMIDAMPSGSLVANFTTVESILQ